MSARNRVVVGKPFEKGFDPRRHKLTTAERALGYRNALAGLSPKCRAKLREKVSWWYAAKRKKNLAGRRRRTRYKPCPPFNPPW